MSWVAILWSMTASACLALAVIRCSRKDWLNMWSLSTPQVAATIAAALVACRVVNAAGERLIGQNVLSSVLVMVLVTAVAGPILTEIFSRRLVAEETPPEKTP